MDAPSKETKRTGCDSYRTTGTSRGHKTSSTTGFLSHHFQMVEDCGHLLHSLDDFHRRVGVLGFTGHLLVQGHLPAHGRVVHLSTRQHRASGNVPSMFSSPESLVVHIKAGLVPCPAGGGCSEETLWLLHLCPSAKWICLPGASDTEMLFIFRIFNITKEYLILAKLISSWSAGEHILRPMGSIFFKAATMSEVCTE